MMSTIILDFPRSEALIGLEPHGSSEVVAPTGSYRRIESKSDGQSSSSSDRNERGGHIDLINVKSILGKLIFGHKKYIILRRAQSRVLVADSVP
jgi:hypothetical protein